MQSLYLVRVRLDGRRTLFLCIWLSFYLVLNKNMFLWHGWELSVSCNHGRIHLRSSQWWRGRMQCPHNLVCLQMFHRSSFGTHLVRGLAQMVVGYIWTIQKVCFKLLVLNYCDWAWYSSIHYEHQEWRSVFPLSVWVRCLPNFSRSSMVCKSLCWGLSGLDRGNFFHLTWICRRKSWPNLLAHLPCWVFVASLTQPSARQFY